MNQLDAIQESLDVTLRSQQAQKTIPTSLLKLRKNSKSMATNDMIVKQIQVLWYDQEKDYTYDLISEFSEELTILDVVNWSVRKINSLRPHSIAIQPRTVQLYLPKKKHGKPNEDFPFFRSNVSLKDTEQTQFAMKVTPPEIVEMRSSYSNSLIRKSRSDAKPRPKKKNTSSFYCLCGNNDDQ